MHEYDGKKYITVDYLVKQLNITPLYLTQCCKIAGVEIATIPIADVPTLAISLEEVDRVMAAHKRDSFHGVLQAAAIYKYLSILAAVIMVIVGLVVFKSIIPLASALFIALQGILVDGLFRILVSIEENTRKEE